MSASVCDLQEPAPSAEMAQDRHYKRARKYHRRTRPQLLSRQDLDGRRNAVQAFDKLVSAIRSDLPEPSAIETRLIEAFAGAAIMLDHLNARILLGHEVSGSEHALTVSAMVRVASRLGLQRRAKDVSLPDPLRYRADEDEAA
jgi:hypothetical protein